MAMADDSLLRQLFFAVGDNSAINSSGAATASRAASSSTGANAPADRIGIADHVEDPEDTENQQEEQGLIEEMFRAFGGDHQEIGNEEPGILEESSASLVDFFGAQNHLENLGSMLQVGLFNRFLKYASKKSCLPDSSPAEGSKVSSTAALTSTIVSHFVHSNAMKSVAAVAEATGRTHKRVGTSLQRVASVMVHASGWMVGCCLSTWRRLFRSGRFKPVAVVDKMLYDETPLKMKIQEWNRFLGQAEGVRHQGPLQETYKFAKILRLDWQLSFIVWDSLLRRHKLITVALPVPLNAVDRNTSECLLAVIDKVHSVIPELEAFCNDFGLRIRMPIIDRFSANFKAERFIKTRQDNLVSSVFTCDVHKQASCIKNAMSLTDDTLSGIINLALSLEGSGSLDRMRNILQEIFSEELVVVYQPPPGEGTEVFRHRQAVLNTFLPLKGMKSRKRRFVLHCLANSDLADHQIVHFCSFGCCRGPDDSLANFRTWVTWALLPSKLGVFNRKSWTGSDVAVHWCGLLASHWHLLPKIILRFLTVDRPRPISADGMEGIDVDPNATQFLADPAIEDMKEFELLFQVRVGRLGGWTNSDCTCDDENDYDYDLVAFFFLKIVSRDLMEPYSMAPSAKVIVP